MFKKDLSQESLASEWLISCQKSLSGEVEARFRGNRGPFSELVHFGRNGSGICGIGVN